MSLLKSRWKGFKKNIFIFLIVYPGRFLLHLILSTCKVTIVGAENFIKTAQFDKCIVMLWHDRIAIGTYIFSIVAPQFLYGAVISNSRDGDLLARLIAIYPQGKAIRVVHTAKYNALRDIISHLNEEKRVIVITPDGPRGPPYKIKPGIIMAARTTGAKIVPMNWNGEVWRLKTWDRLMIPKPFSKITVTFGPPITFASEPSENDIPTLQKSLA
jgi:lysophospholipid acyltransferase (LPLAT)-like uncharacterized protein